MNATFFLMWQAHRLAIKVANFSILSVLLMAFPVMAQETASQAVEGIEPEGLFFETLHSGNASQAETILGDILSGKMRISPDMNPASLLLAMGNYYCEQGNYDKGKFWLEKVNKEYGAQIADEENQISYATLLTPKLTWLQAGGKRSWVASDPRILAQKIVASLQKFDPKQVRENLAQIDTYVGWWESEYENIPPDTLLEHIQKNLDKEIKWVNESEFQKALQGGEKLLYVNTHGWKDMQGYTNIQFAIHQISEGWEWRGIVFGESK